MDECEKRKKKEQMEEQQDVETVKAKDDAT
jgi:hypothetical protein